MIGLNYIETPFGKILNIDTTRNNLIFNQNESINY